MSIMFLRKLIDPFEYLFWRMQISVLRACPPLSGMIAKASLGAGNSRSVWVKVLFLVIKQVPRAILLHWRNKDAHRIVLSRVTLPVTMRCTLNCDKCVAYIPDLKKQEDIPLNCLAQDIKSLFACVDHIYAINLSGGEAFLRYDLDEIIRICAASGKVGDINVETNGTVIPDERIVAALKNSGANVKISRYPLALQPDAEKLKSILKENEIPYTHASGTFWRDVGRPGQLQSGSKERRFSVCIQQLCWTYFNGKLHRCPVSATLFEEDFVSDCGKDYIDLHTICPAAFPDQLRGILKKHAVSACAYCLGNTYNTPKIPVAVQREP